MTRAPLSRDRREQVDTVVAGILEDMVSGRWVAGRSHKAIAEREGVSVERVKDWAAEAGRTLRILALVDREDMRARNAARLDAIAADAHADGEYGDAVRAISEQGKLLGLNPPEKHQHAHVVATYEQLEPAAKRAQLVEAIAALQAELAALPIEADEPR